MQMLRPNSVVRLRCNKQGVRDTTATVQRLVSRPRSQTLNMVQLPPAESLWELKRADGAIGTETEERKGIFEFPDDGGGVWWRLVQD